MAQKSNYQYDKRFYDEGWDKWHDMKRYGPTSLHLRRLLLRIMKDLKVDTIIDVGCGEGSLLKEIGKIKNVPLFGVDISETAIKRAKENVPHATFAVLDIERSPNPCFGSKNRFDLVIVADVIEHIYNDKAAIENLKKLSKKYVLISTIQGKMRHSERKMGHYRSYQKNELEAKLKGTGIDIVRKIEWGFPFYSPLCRNLLNTGDFTKITTGRYGLFRILLARLVWLLFYLNLPFWGDYLIVLGKVKRPK